MKRLLFLLLVAAASPVLAQSSEITLADIWQDYKFYPQSPEGFNFLKDGRNYTRVEGGKINAYDVETDALSATLFDVASRVQFDEEFTLSNDEQKILLQTGKESIYRRSSKANFYVYDRSTKKMNPLSVMGKQQYATFSPDGSKVAFCRDNNLFYKDLKTDKEVQITKDGKYNSIINGSSDWVYEEEFEVTRCFVWSPDGTKIAFLRYDETAVPEFLMDYYKNTLYPEHYTFKYPKAGEKNAIVTAWVHDLTKKKTIPVDLGKDYEYIPRLSWTQDANTFCLTRMNRHQSNLDLLLVDSKTGKTRLLLNEQSDTYIDVTFNLTFLKNGKEFIWTSEKDGFNHIYLYGMDGKLIRQITKGDWEMTAFYGVDEAQGWVYYQSNEGSPLRRNVYRIRLSGEDKTRLTKGEGTAAAEFSPTFSYFTENFSNVNTPPQFTLRKADGTTVKLLEDNAALSALVKPLNIKAPEFYTFKTSEGIELNGMMIKPADFDATKKYPVFCYFYGGPGSQEVADDWDSFNRMFFQMLVKRGYLISIVDNRGTGGRGAAFKKCTYKQLGKFEAMDQIEAGRWLAKQPYVDGSRIGCFGWSFGGYMSSLLITKGADVFKAAIAVAPVTNWKWYDSIYTERYLQTPAENPSGYEDNSPVNFAGLMKGKFLLIHGMADDNVHFQNGAEMANALILKQKQFDCYFYPNSNHGIGYGAKRMHLYQKMLDFIGTNL